MKCDHRKIQKLAIAMMSCPFVNGISFTYLLAKLNFIHQKNWVEHFNLVSTIKSVHYFNIDGFEENGQFIT